MNAKTDPAPAPPMPQIAAIECVDHLVVRVTWQAGIRAQRTDVVDLSPLICSLKFYRQLRDDRDLFRTVHLIENGRAIAWLNGIDMPAVSIEQLAQQNTTEEPVRSDA